MGKQGAPALSREVEAIEDYPKPPIAPQRVEKWIHLDPCKATVADRPGTVEEGESPVLVAQRGVDLCVLIARGVAKFPPKGHNDALCFGPPFRARCKECLAH